MTHPMFCFQMKLRKAIPKSIREWSDSIHRSAVKAGKMGVLIVKEPGKHDDNALVIVRYRDWVDLHGTTKPFLSVEFAEAIVNPPAPNARLKAAARKVLDS